MAPSEETTPIKGNENEGTVKTSLSIHPEWQIKTEERYVYMFKNNQCPPLLPNQLSLHGLEMHTGSDGIMITAFVRSTVDQTIRLGGTTIVLMGPSGEKLARKRFDLNELGELPPNSSRPWHFFFPASSFLSDQIPESGWNLAFELQPKHRLDLDENWEKSLADEDKAKLEQLVSQIKAPKPGEVNFMGIQARRAEDESLHVTILIRNGSDKHVTFEQLPLQVRDADNEVIAKGGFKLDKLEVKANTSKPWTFIFPKATITKDILNLSRWKVEIIRQVN